jgi:hypothetical protein
MLSNVCGDCQEVNLGVCISVNCEEQTGFFSETIEVLSPKSCATEAAQSTILVINVIGLLWCSR